MRAVFGWRHGRHQRSAQSTRQRLFRRPSKDPPGSVDFIFFYQIEAILFFLSDSKDQILAD
jgi:hypothetical protein